jgi:nitric oxide reductase subunit C
MKGAGIIFSMLCTGFLAYSATIYIQPALQKKNGDSSLTADGKLVWQKYNCQSCHQLFGLGGYLGPDLTNVVSAPGKGAPYLEAMITMGTQQMPAFRMSKSEMNALIGFLRSVNEAGNGDPRSYHVYGTGMIAPG